MKQIPIKEVLAQVSINEYDEFYNNHLIIKAKGADNEYRYNPVLMKEIVRELIGKAYTEGFNHKRRIIKERKDKTKEHEHVINNCTK